MSILTAQAYQNYTTADRNDYNKITPLFKFYESEEDNQDTTIYTGDFTWNAVAGGTSSFKSSKGPRLARKYVTPFSYDEDNKPYAVLDNQYLNIVAAAASDGVELTGSFSTTDGDFIALVMRADAPVDVTVVIEEGANSASATISAVGSAWSTYIVPVSNFTGGSPDLEALDTIGITLGAAGDVDVYTVSFANNPGCFVGSENTIKFDCIDEVTMEDILEVADKTCGNFTTGKTPTSIGETFSLTYHDLNFKTEAAVSGETIKRGATNKVITLNAEVGGLAKQIVDASGNITLSPGIAPRRISVSFAGIPLNRVEFSADVDVTSFHYDTTTGVYTFDTSYEGQTPLVENVVSSAGNYYERRNLKTGAVGNLLFTRVTDGGVTITREIFICQLVKLTANQGDAQEAHTVEMVALPKKVGRNNILSRRSKS